MRFVKFLQTALVILLAWRVLRTIRDRVHPGAIALLSQSGFDGDEKLLQSWSSLNAKTSVRVQTSVPVLLRVPPPSGSEETRNLETPG